MGTQKSAKTPLAVAKMIRPFLDWKLYNLKYASKHLRTAAAAAAATSLTRHSMLILSAQTSFLHLVHAYLFREKLEIHIVLHQPPARL